ncbi:MAG: cation:proton antiporter [Bacteroidales bacterium]|jgi:NhaP-type Na+/H+ or K+/H+ antiporter|nr:cation:proton antiporter [Bacteroidales bacterium]
MGETLVFLGLLVFAAHFFSMIFSKKKVSDVLLLMIIGIIIGPLLNLVSPSSFGSVGEVFTTITLVVILFEGALDISINDLQRSWKTTIRLTLINAVCTVVLSSILCLLFELSMMSSLIIGCALIGTAAAVVIPMSNYLKLGNATKTALVLEAALSDVICIVSTLGLIDAAKLGEGLNIFKIAGNILASFVIATIIGVGSALIWASLLEKVRKLRNSMFLTPAYLFFIYGVTELMGFSGAIAVLAFGITITNMEYFHFKFITRFQQNKEHLMLNAHEESFISEIVFFLKTLFFVYIGLSITFENLTSLIIGLSITFLLLVARICVARNCSPKSANTFDKSIIGSMIPKGLATAVLASIPAQMGLPNGEMIKTIAFAVVFFSILICSICVFLIENVSGVRSFFDLVFGNNNNKSKE